MINDSHLELIRSKGTVVGRLLIGFLFLASGLMMLFMQGPAAVGGYFTSLGIPAGILVAYLAIAIKVIAGALIMMGKHATDSAAVLIVFTLIATLLAHIDPAKDPTFPIGLLKNLAIVGGLLFLMAYGPHGTDILGDDPGELPKRA